MDEQESTSTVGELAADVLRRAESEGKLAPPPTPEEEKKTSQLANDEARAAFFRRLVHSFGVPFKDAVLIYEKKLEDRKALLCVKRFREISSHGGVLVLSGPTGVGKTTAASWFACKGPPLGYPMQASGVWPQEMHPIFVSAHDLQRMGLFDRSGYERLKSCSVLVIDELGVEFSDTPGAFRTSIESLFNSRYAGIGWTIVTTNLIRKIFLQRYGDRILDRLSEKGRGFVHLDLGSMRGEV